MDELRVRDPDPLDASDSAARKGRLGNGERAPVIDSITTGDWFAALIPAGECSQAAEIRRRGLRACLRYEAVPGVLAGL
jgi:hypothetical protein